MGHFSSRERKNKGHGQSKSGRHLDHLGEVEFECTTMCANHAFYMILLGARQKFEYIQHEGHTYQEVPGTQASNELGL